jgi:hypothetical protein
MEDRLQMLRRQAVEAVPQARPHLLQVQQGEVLHKPQELVDVVDAEVAAAVGVACS